MITQSQTWLLKNVIIQQSLRLPFIIKCVYNSKHTVKEPHIGVTPTYQLHPYKAQILSDCQKREGFFANFCFRHKHE